MNEARPQVTLKLATSLDGRIALANGASKWITGEKSRAEVHNLRASHDVMLTGIGTVLADDPKLTARPGGTEADRQPRRAVMDSRARTPADGNFVKTGPVTIFHVNDRPPAALQDAGAELIRIAPQPDGRASLIAALSWLHRTGARTLMIEAGGALASRAIASGIVDRIEWFRAPMILGGDGLPAIAALGLESLTASPTFHRVAVRECGDDLWETWERR